MIDRVGQCDLRTQAVAEEEDGQIPMPAGYLTPEQVEVVDPVGEALDVDTLASRLTMSTMVHPVYGPTVWRERIDDVLVSPSVLAGAVAEQDHASDPSLR